MKLYYKPGACSLASHIALYEIGAPFELDKTDTEAGLTESGENFADISPNGYVPALKTQAGDILTENPAILQFLADQKPESRIAPACGTIERVRLQELLNFLSSELHKAFGPFFSGTELSVDAKALAEHNVARLIDHIEYRLGDGRPFLLGEDFSVADAYAFVVLNWTSFVGIDLDGWPITQGFVARVRLRPATIKAMTAEGLIETGQAA